MLAITYTLKRKRIKVAKWGTPKKYLKKKKKKKKKEYKTIRKKQLYPCLQRLAHQTVKESEILLQDKNLKLKNFQFFFRNFVCNK